MKGADLPALISFQAESFLLMSFFFVLFLDQLHLLTREGLGLLIIATISFTSMGALYHTIRRYRSATARCAIIPDENPLRG